MPPLTDHRAVVPRPPRQSPLLVAAVEANHLAAQTKNTTPLPLSTQTETLVGRICTGPAQSSPNTASNLHSTMKIEKANAGHLTNFEVLDFLRTRGAKTDPMGCLEAVAASECKGYEYLLKTPACNQTRESVTEFANRCEGFKPTDADKQNIINWRPTSVADVYVMVEECGKRFSKDEQGGAQNEEERAKELLGLVNEIFPRPPTEQEDAVEVDMKDI